MKTTTSLLPFCQLPNGSLGRVRALRGDGSFCQRIREMGFGEEAVLTKVSGTGPFLCQVNNTRFALSHDVAQNILVEQLAWW